MFWNKNIPCIIVLRFNQPDICRSVKKGRNLWSNLVNLTLWRNVKLLWRWVKGMDRAEWHGIGAGSDVEGVPKSICGWVLRRLPNGLPPAWISWIFESEEGKHYFASKMKNFDEMETQLNFDVMFKVKTSDLSNEFWAKQDECNWSKINWFFRGVGSESEL
jgi:hypothetical protein